MFVCKACDSFGFSFTYQCDACDVSLHVPCAVLPETLVCGDHQHPLSLVFSLDDGRRYHDCGVCGIDVNELRWSYSCKECDFFAHLDCASVQAPTAAAAADDDDGDHDNVVASEEEDDDDHEDLSEEEEEAKEEECDDDDDKAGSEIGEKEEYEVDEEGEEEEDDDDEDEEEEDEEAEDDEEDAEDGDEEAEDDDEEEDGGEEAEEDVDSVIQRNILRNAALQMRINNQNARRLLKMQQQRMIHNPHSVFQFRLL